jgi:4-hydroxymandelate oxidase
MGDEPAVNLAELEERARAILTEAVFGFFAGGAEDELTLAANRAAFRDVRLWQRVLVDVRTIDTATTVLGQPVALPVLIAPVALQALVHPEGERAMACGAAEAGTIMVLSTVSSVALEEVFRAAPGPLWFQLYLPVDRGAAAELVARAEAAGARALVLTVDAPVLGRRERDLRTGFRLPSGASQVVPSDGGLSTHGALGSLLNPGLGWNEVAWLRSATRLPVVLKGILHPDDARRSAEAGVDGIVVSNHGGRQLDGAPATVEVLERAVAAVGGAAEVYLDGGVRRGTDVVRALALGARAVWVGRPAVWGLATGGTDGVAGALGLLRAELERSMALCGCRTVSEIGPELLVRSS